MQSNVKLDGVVEADETFFLLALKVNIRTLNYLEFLIIEVIKSQLEDYQKSKFVSLVYAI